MPGNKNKCKGQGETQKTTQQREITTQQNNNNSFTSGTKTTDILGQSRELLYGAHTNLPNLVDAKHDQQTFPNITNVNNVRPMYDTGHQYIQYVNPNQQHSGQLNQQFGGQSVPFMQYTSQPLNGPSMDNSIPPWAASLCQQMSNIQTMLDNHTQKWQMAENNMTLQNQKLNKMETQLSEISNLKQKITYTDTKVHEVQNELKMLKRKVSDYDDTMDQYGAMYDDMASNNSETDKKISEIESRMEKLEQKQNYIGEQVHNTNEKLTDIRWRSMRENLLFFGIPEAENFDENGEDCETKIKEFINNQMGIEKEISLDRAHRLGRYSNRYARPRPIIAKFTFYKDRELVRMSAPQVLNDTNYGISEQFPQEIEEKRKKLYNIAKSARENKNNKVRLVRDKLYINGKLYTHDAAYETRQTTTHINADERRSRKEGHNNTKHYTQRRREGDSTGQSWGISRTRTFMSTTRGKNNNFNETNGIQTRNRFSWFGENTPENYSDRPTYGGKKKATSPLEQDTIFKKQHFDIDSSDDETTMDTENTHKQNDNQNSHSIIENNTYAPDINSQSPLSPSMTIQPSAIVTIPSSIAERVQTTNDSSGEFARASRGEQVDDDEND